MKTTIRVCLFFFLVAGAWAQQPTLVTESARTLGAYQGIVGAGAEFLAKKRAPNADDPQTEWRVGALAVRFGVAQNVNFDIEWRGGLVAMAQDGTRRSDWGDLTVATKINVLDEEGGRPALGMRSAVKLPNTSYLPHKLGNDQTDYYFHVLAEKTIGAAELRFNGGLGIVGNPRDASQDDIYIASAAVLSSAVRSPRVFLEVYGFTGSAVNTDKLLARAGAMVEMLDLQCTLFASRRILGNPIDFSSAFEASQDLGLGIFLERSLKF